MRKIWKLTGVMRDGTPLERYFDSEASARSGAELFAPDGVITSLDMPDDPSDDAERAAFAKAMRDGEENHKRIQESIEALHAHHARHYRGEK